MKAKTLYSTFVVLTMLAIVPLDLSARTLGMVADDATDSVTVFDADTHAVLGTVSIDPGNVIGDVFITPDLKRGFVTNEDFNVFVIDLTTSPPSLAPGTNPIPISGAGEDLAISPDEKFLVVAAGTFFASGPMSVIDIATQSEVDALLVGGGNSTHSVDVCSDRSVLAGTDFNFTVSRLTLSATGTLTETGEILFGGGGWNAYCAPGAKSGVTIGNRIITSFTIPGLSEIDTRSLSGSTGMNGAINKAGNRVFVRSNDPGSIDVFDFNPATGALGATPLLTFSVGDAALFLGIDQIALHPDGTKLFVSEPSSGMSPSAVKVYSASTGALIASITDPNIVTPTGVTVMTEADPCALPPPPGAIMGTNGADILNGTPGNDIIFSLGGNDQINGGGGNDLICGGPGNDQLNGGAGDDVLNATDGVNGNDQLSGSPGSDQCIADPGDAVSSCNP